MHYGRPGPKARTGAIILLAGALLLFAGQPVTADGVKGKGTITICTNEEGPLGPRTMEVEQRQLGVYLRAGATVGACTVADLDLELCELPVDLGTHSGAADSELENVTGHVEYALGPCEESGTGGDPPGNETGEDPNGEDPNGGNETEPCDGLLSLRVRVEGETNVLEWDLVASAEAYIVYRAEVGGDFEELATLNATTELYVDADVVVGTTYQYTVTTIEAGVETSVCVIIDITVGGDDEDTELCDGLLSLRVRAEAETNVLEWDLIVGAEAYAVYRAEVGGDFEQIATVNGSTAAFVDADIVVGVTYEYFVTAVVAGVETSVCVVVEVTAIPVFAHALAAFAASAAGVGAYVFARRR